MQGPVNESGGLPVPGGSLLTWEFAKQGWERDVHPQPESEDAGQGPGFLEVRGKCHALPHQPQDHLAEFLLGCQEQVCLSPGDSGCQALGEQRACQK